MIDTTTTQLVPLRTLAKRLGITMKWLRAETDADRIPHLQAGNRTLYNVGAVRDCLLQRAARGGDS